ncbi:sugar transferase [Patescibacteria group bacterium]|nr:sugar transferase [Patescibacteria group bacterium]
MKKAELIISTITLPLDYLTLVFAATTAYWIRYLTSVQEIRPIIFNLAFRDYFIWTLLIAVIWLIFFAIAGLYVIGGSRSLMTETSKVFLACSTGMLAVILGLFFTRELFSSRFIVLATWFLTISFVSFERLVVRLIQRRLYRRGVGVHKVAIIGDDITGKSVIDELQLKPNLGYQILKTINRINDQTLDELEQLKEELDEIIHINTDASRQDILKLVDFANDNHIGFKYMADLLGARLINLQIEAIAGVPIVEIKKTPLDGWGRILKRIFDFVISLILVVLLSPILFLTAIAIKIDSKGSVLFKYQRVGQKGEPFSFIKFRSMKAGTHELRYDKEFQQTYQNLRAGSPMIKIKEDPRITVVGKFIRRWSIDELPQLFSVLNGNMSLVGPRPHEVEEVNNYAKHHRRVFTIKPGITGLAQISGRSDLDFEEEIRLDTFYIENWSLKLDLSILARTPWAVVKRRQSV